MLVKHHPKFDKHYQKRIAPIASLNQKFKQRLNLLIANPQHPALGDHPLRGTTKPLRAFSITGDIRTVYRKINDDEIILIDIGSHNQVY